MIRNIIMNMTKSKRLQLTRIFFAQRKIVCGKSHYINSGANFKSSQNSEVRIQKKTEFEFKFNSVSWILTPEFLVLNYLSLL